MSNPILNSAFNERPFEVQSAPMTVNGVVSKLGLMAVLMAIAGGITWYQFAIGNVDKVNMLMYGGFIVGFILAMVACFARKATKYVIPFYAVAEGAALSGVSCYFEAMLPGIVIKAVSLTFLTLFAMLFLYATKAIQVTDKLRGTIFTMTVALMVFYIITWILSLFHINIPMLYSSSPLSIGFSVFVCGLAAFNLLVDFDFIEQGVRNYFPKDYEWFGAFGLMVTLVWLYMEILRLLAKFANRR